MVAAGWFAFWALETRTYIVADMTAHWYWHGKASGALSRAAKHGFVAHFGSIAFAGLVLWFVEQCKAIVRKANSGKGCVALLCCLIKCVVMMCLSYLEYLCKMSIVMMGISGKSFTSAGSDVVSLFTASFGDMALSTNVWIFPSRVVGFFAFLLSLVAGGVAGLFTYLAVKDLKNQPQGSDAAADAVNYGLSVFVASMLVVFYLLSFFGNVLLVVVDSVFMCFMVDKSKGVVTKPQIHDVLNQLVDRHYTKQGKRVPDTFGNSDGNVQATTTVVTTSTVVQQPGGYYPTLPQSKGEW